MTTNLRTSVSVVEYSYSHSSESLSSGRSCIVGVCRSSGGVVWNCAPRGASGISDITAVDWGGDIDEDDLRKAFGTMEVGDVPIYVVVLFVVKFTWCEEMMPRGKLVVASHVRLTSGKSLLDFTSPKNQHTTTTSSENQNLHKNI